MPERRVAAPGWYPDPASDDDIFRWWNGHAWTAWLSSDPDAEDPPIGRPDLEPAASAEVPPRPVGRFGTVHRVTMLAVVLMVVVAAIVVTGWPERERVAFTQPLPTSSYQPPDLTLVCADDWSVGGEIGATIPDEFSNLGPQKNDAIGYLHCRAHLRGVGGNVLFSLGLAESSEASLQDHAEQQIADFARSIYTKGPVEPEVVSSRADQELGPGWRVTATLTPPDSGATDRVELVVVELESGRRAIWIQLVGDEVDEEGLAMADAVLGSLARS